ncbi:MAG: PTS sugar transporter subunit IIA [Spirochaetes bacterium]|jgi:fructose-specific phosphotransferase system IIA component|nr:PTS sugar transporter subunit IIA [Spirochaetota bacterium]
MIFSDNLNKNNIILKSSAENRWDLIEEMLDLAIKNKEVKIEDRDQLKKALFDREKSMSTGIGKSVAIPHCTTGAIEEIIIIIAICSNEIDFASIDNQPVKIAIFLLVPKKKLKQHIKTLANIAKIMSNDEVKEKILNSKSAEALIKAIKDYEKEL